MAAVQPLTMLYFEGAEIIVLTTDFHLAHGALCAWQLSQPEPHQAVEPPLPSSCGSTAVQRRASGAVDERQGMKASG